MKKCYLLLLLCIVLASQGFSQAILQESFEGSFPPAGWTLINNGTGNPWTQNTTATYAYDGTKSMQLLYNFSNAADAWAFTPPLTLNTNPVTITFWTRVRSATYPENLKLTVGTGNTVAAQTTVLYDTVGMLSTTFQKVTATYTAPSAGTYYFAFNCYSPANMWYVYVDSVTISQLLPGCTGAPTGGTAAASASAVCASTGFSVSVSGSTGGASGLTYQWQDSPDGINWTDIAGETNSTYSNTAGISASTYYRRKIDCGGSVALSTSVKIDLNGAALCACSPSTGTILHGGTTPSIDSVNIIGTALHAANVGEPADGYNSFSTPTTDLMQGVSYTLYTGFSGAAIASVWFDWNQDGIFDPSEWTQITTSGTNGSITFNVPVTAVLGKIIVRIRTRGSGNQNGAADGCTEFFSGETEDYFVNIISGTPCAGTPTAGTTASTVSAVCPNVPFSLSTTGGTSGVTGLTYQWQFSTDNGITPQDITGADSANHTEISGITANTCYRRSITCGGSTVFSNWVCVTVNPTIYCPCSPNTGTNLHSTTTNTPSIDAVNIPGTKLTNASAGAPAGGYTLFSDTAKIPTIAQGVSYTLNTTYSGAAISSVWFDWNQDGVFDTNEWLQVTTNAATGSITFTVDPTAVLGQTIMRIRTASSGSTNGDVDPCTTFFSGETEDYVINIVAGTPCTGNPLGGAAVSAAGIAFCPSTPFNLTVTGATSGVTGLTYQWQISTDSGANYTDIVGADSLSHYETAGITSGTCYRRAIVCGGNKVYSTSVCIAVNPAILCPCSPFNGTQLHSSTSPSIDTVSIQGTKLNVAHPGVPNGGYSFYGDTAYLPTLTQGKTYYLYTGYSAAPTQGSAWFDWNQDGVFDASEYVPFTISGTSSITAFTVPTNPNSVVGLTLMRIRIRAATYADADACATFGSGETEDYVINIQAGVTCSGTPTPGAAFIVSPTVLCALTPFTLDVSGATPNQGNLTYQWQYSSDSLNWNDIGGETSSMYTNAIGITDSMYYRRVIDCNGSPALSTPIKVKLSGAVSSFPFVESFESLSTFGAGILPNCWTTVATGTKFTSAGSPVRNAKPARTGSKYVWSKYSSSAYLISPSLQLTGGKTYNFSYYYRPTDPTNGFNIKTFVGTSSDTTALQANQLGTTIVNPKDSSAWTLASYNYTVPTTGTYYFAIYSLAPVAPWYLMFDDINISEGALPVKLIQFKGEKQANKNYLTWTTATEADNKGFEILRSFNGTDFNSIGFVATKAEHGTSISNLNYNFTDNESAAGNVYYRLKQVDVNGKQTLSEIVLIKGIKTNKIEFAAIYPNPAKEKLSVVIAAPSSQNLNIVITDISGRTVKQETLFANEGNNQLNLNVAGLQSGTYLIKVSCNNGCEAAVQKFVKQ